MFEDFLLSFAVSIALPAVGIFLVLALMYRIITPRGDDRG